MIGFATLSYFNGGKKSGERSTGSTGLKRPSMHN